MKAAAEADPTRSMRWRLLANIQGTRGMVLLGSGHADQALRQMDEALATLLKEMAAAPSDFIAKRDEVAIRGAQASILLKLGRDDEALAGAERAVGAARRLLEIDRDNVLVRENICDLASWVGEMYARRNALDRARESYETAASEAKAC